MTRNQIAYQELLEKQRANLAQEAENARANMAREAYQTEANAIARENIALGYANQENQRRIAEINAGASYYAANLNYAARQAETELGYAQLSQRTQQEAFNSLLENAKLTSSQQYNYDFLDYQYATLAETQRSNQTREAETHRHNVVSEVTNAVNALGSTVANITKTATEYDKFVLLNP